MTRLEGVYRASSPALRGAAFVLVSTLCFSMMHGGIRYLGHGMHPFEIAFFRNLFGLLVILPWLVRVGPSVLKTNNFRLHALRGLLQVIAMTSFFTALTLAPLAEVSAMSFTAPLFASLGAALVLGEAMRLRRWSALALGFLGALVIIRPGIATINPGIVLVLFSSCLWATAMLVIKRLSRTDSSVTITAYMGLFLTPLSLAPALLVWRWPHMDEFAILAAIGSLGSLAHIAMAQAFKEADASYILPFDFTRLIWASVIGFILFAEVPDLWTWIGGFIIFASTTYIALREAKLKGRTPAVAVGARTEPPG